MDPRPRRRPLGRRRCPDVVFEVMAPDDRLVAALPGALPRTVPASRAWREARPAAGTHHGAGYPGDQPRPRGRRTVSADTGPVGPQGHDRCRAGAPSPGRELLAALLRQG